MDEYRFAGYRIVEFSKASKEALCEIANILVPHETAILDEWVRRQCRAWEPPGLCRSELRNAFAEILRDILGCMQEKQLELCIEKLEEAGADLAARNFPFEALVISVHFLEESYLPYILSSESPKTQHWLVSMDVFLHAAIASISTSYFQAYRKELLDKAEVGRIVQEGLLADIPRRAADLEIAHVYISAREQAQLGGDFLDFFAMAQGGATFIIGDLAGHGLEAAADSVMMRSLFRAFMSENADMTEAMARLNNVLMGELKSGLFATALAVRYDPPGKISLVSAGHPYPIMCNAEGHLLETNGMALAVLEDSQYEVTEAELSPGGVFVAYTDGLVEARSPGREFFGDARAIEAVVEMRTASARGIAEHLIDTSLRHAGGRFADDVAVLVLKRRK